MKLNLNTMKNQLFLLVFLFGSLNSVFSQYEPTSQISASGDRIIQEKGPKRPAEIYLEAGAGFNYKFGVIGLGIAARINDNLIMDAAGGVGGWGNKYSLSATFKANETNHWCPSIGLSRSMGEVNQEQTISVTYLGKSETATAFMTFHPVSYLNLTVQRQFVSKKRGNRMLIEFGYAVQLNEARYDFTNSFVTVKSNSTQTDVALALAPINDIGINTLNFLSSGGFLVGFCYQFAFR